MSNAANPIVDAVARDGILRAARSLRTAVADGGNIIAREDMSIASLLGGFSLANAKLGAVHGYASVLGGKYCTYQRTDHQSKSYLFRYHCNRHV